MKKTHIFYAVTGGMEFDALLALGNFAKRSEAITEAKKHRCAEITRIKECGPVREKKLIKIIGAENAKPVAW